MDEDHHCRGLLGNLGSVERDDFQTALELHCLWAKLTQYLEETAMSWNESATAHVEHR